MQGSGAGLLLRCFACRHASREARALHYEHIGVRAQIMEPDVLVLDEKVPFQDLLAGSEGPVFRHVVVTKEHAIFGVLRINTGLRFE